MNRSFFGSLDHQSKTLETAFNLLKERKINYFDPSTIELLVEGDHDKLAQLQKKPSILGNYGRNESHKILMQIEKLNMQSKISFSNIPEDLSLEDLSYFRRIGIHYPLPLQAIAFNFCK